MCVYAPEGDQRNNCYASRDRICLKMSCTCKEGWILDPETGGKK